MSIALHIDYKFELNGKVYEAIGAEFGETEKESDIEALNADIEYEEEKEKFASVNFEYVEVFN